VLSQGEPRDAAVDSNAYRILQRHRAVSLPQQAFLYTSATLQMLKLHYADFHGRDAKSRR